MIFKKKKEDGYNRKKVQQIKNGKVVKEYNSVNDIERKKGYAKGHITECCNGKRKTAYGYKWQYKEPLFERNELECFDNYIHDIVKEYSNLKLSKKEEILTQRIIMKQEEEINRLKETIVDYELRIKKALEIALKNCKDLSNILNGCDEE